MTFILLCIAIASVVFGGWLFLWLVSVACQTNYFIIGFGVTCLVLIIAGSIYSRKRG